MSDELDSMGPIDYIILEFPGNHMNGEAFPELLSLVDRGLIRILDLVFVTKDAAGDVAGVALNDIDLDGDFDVAVFAGASSGLIDQDDIAEASNALEPNSSAAILVYENSWAAPFASAVRRSGGQLVASGRIPVQAILASLEALEAEEAGD